MFQETGDPKGLEEFVGTYMPDYAKQFKKQGSPFAAMAPLLTGQGKGPQSGVTDRNAMEQEQDSALAAGNPTQTPVLPNRSTIQPGTPPPPRKTLFGMELPTDEEKATRATNMGTSALQAQVEARRSIAQRMGLTPEQTQQYALTGELPTAGRASTLHSLSPNERLVNEQGQEVARGLERSTTAPADLGTIGDYILTKQQELGRELTSAEILQTRKDWQAIQSSTNGGQDVSALAAMAAQSPSVLQGLTPTVVGGVMSAIASDPKLRAQYEETRMEPIRGQATQALTALDDLLQFEVDPKTKEKKVIGLTDGAKNLYGAGLIGRASRFYPGSAGATAKAALDQITGALTLDMIQDMKAQSRTGATGFGQLNIQELAVLQNAATVLKGEISEARALQELTNLYDRFNKVMLPSAATVANTTGNAAVTLDTPIFIGKDGRPSLTPP
jgi:hypothetical protein